MGSPKESNEVKTRIGPVPVKITPAIKFTLEECLEFIKDDELVEVTPETIRMRKLYLDPHDRKKYNLKKMID